jgi:hypothetical protein
MDTVLQLLDRGLQGDADALTFLERTASIYIFDGTNSRQPKTFGIWDFLNQRTSFSLLTNNSHWNFF